MNLRPLLLLCLCPLTVPAATVEILPAITSAKLPRIGLNLGDWNAWGAAQLLANVLKNPGFEGVIDRTIVIVAHAGPQGFDDDMSWSGRPDGFWAGARFDVYTGAAAGRGGVLADSRKKGKDGLPTFAPLQAVPGLAAGDVVVLTRTDDGGFPSQWSLPNNALPGSAVAVLDDQRPGSPGLRALALQPTPGQPARVISYLDSIGDRAGKLLPLDGRWALALWARSPGGDATLKASLQRVGSPPFLKESRALSKDWQRVEFAFSPADSGPPGTLALELAAEGGRLLLDDVSLVKQGETAGAFRQEVGEVLAKLQPGYLRDWQGQLGDTWENRIAEPFAQRASRYRPGADDRFGYSLPAFLDLCKQIGALPWLVLPTTFSDAEYQAAGRYLAGRARADGFAEILVEFGNENWNAMFRPAGLSDPKAHGAMAGRAFAHLRSGAGPDAPLRLTVNGQAVVPSYALRMLDSAPAAQVLAVAPYLAYQINRADVAASPWPVLFKPDHDLPLTAQGVSQRGKELAAYEVNLHTTQGDIPADLRGQMVTGAASGAALAQRLLETLNSGVRRQCVYNLAQYDFFMADRTAVKLWGVARDLGPTRRLRPTGLGLALLNRALPGDAHALRISGAGAETLTAAAIQRADGWALALVSAAAKPQTVQVRFSDTGAKPRHLLRLQAAGPAASNEDSEQVRIVEQDWPAGRDSAVEVPAWGLVVLVP
ncbi:MAG: hypothetical protein ACKN9T_04365 [Candidatus Methylumidiphilus sp.]